MPAEPFTENPKIQQKGKTSLVSGARGPLTGAQAFLTSLAGKLKHHTYSCTLVYPNTSQPLYTNGRSISLFAHAKLTESTCHQRKPDYRWRGLATHRQGTLPQCPQRQPCLKLLKFAFFSCKDMSCCEHDGDCPVNSQLHLAPDVLFVLSCFAALYKFLVLAKHMLSVGSQPRTLQMAVGGKLYYCTNGNFSTLPCLSAIYPHFAQPFY